MVSCVCEGFSGSATTVIQGVFGHKASGVLMGEKDKSVCCHTNPVASFSAGQLYMLVWSSCVAVSCCTYPQNAFYDSSSYVQMSCQSMDWCVVCGGQGVNPDIVQGVRGQK